ncbi:MAG: pyridoxal 5'-phosphate synthase glutaminase subunit PdxT [Desulfovibrio sp.]|nr:pyridoxal 5'-phosphate synthase glutaminase subunit PdxT [Desulfovibrio sp.]
MTPLIGVLALQGAFREHIDAFKRLGVGTREIRALRDIAGIDALAIPGGESTTIGKLLTDTGLMPATREKIASGLPVFGTCAGMILLCEEIEDSSQPRLGSLKAKVRRNAFGSQVDSFEENLLIPELGDPPFPAVFIRAPFITGIGDEARVLATVNKDGENYIAAVRQDNILTTAFHPELTADDRFHKYFLKMIGNSAKRTT